MMFKLFGLLLLSPLFVVGFAVRLAFFLPFAVLFLLPMVIMRPKMLVHAPRMFKYMLLAKRSGWAGYGHRGGGRQVVTVIEPILL